MESLTIQGQLVASTDAFLAPEPNEGAKYFIIEEYYSDSDASMMTLKRKEDGSFVGTLVIDNALYMDFTGRFEKEVLVATQADAYPDTNPYKLNILSKVFSHYNEYCHLSSLPHTPPWRIGLTGLHSKNAMREKHNH